MRTLRVILAACLAVLVGCQSPPPTVTHDTKAYSGKSKRPTEVFINPDAGRGNLIIVKVRLKDIESASFVVDTGAGITCIDESLTPKLGRSVGKEMAHHWGENSEQKLYAAPRLYLGGVCLRGGNVVMAMDFKWLSAYLGEPIAGVIGMDVLTNYCVQLDFVANELRLLDESQEDKSSWGRAFPMTGNNAHDPRPAVAGNLLGDETSRAVIDSGYDVGGWLAPEHYEQWNNGATSSLATVHSPDARFHGDLYSNLSLRQEEGQMGQTDGLGLQFLVRHLVTLDFPNQTLYLKRTSIEALTCSGGTVMTYLQNLKHHGQLPGWTKDEHGTPSSLIREPGANTFVVEVKKDGDSSIYHYRVTEAAMGRSWSLIKAWRTDAQGQVLEEYLVH